MNPNSQLTTWVTWISNLWCLPQQIIW